MGNHWLSDNNDLLVCNHATFQKTDLGLDVKNGEGKVMFFLTSDGLRSFKSWVQDDEKGALICGDLMFFNFGPGLGMSVCKLGGDMICYLQASVVEEVRNWINPQLHVFVVDDGESHFYVADSEGDAKRQHLNLSGEYLDADCELEVYQMADDKMLRVADCDDGKTINQPCRDWASTGKGLIASSAY